MNAASAAAPCGSGCAGVAFAALRRPTAREFVHWLWLVTILGAAASCSPPPLVRRSWSPAQGYEELLLEPCRQLDQVQDLSAEARLTVHRQDRSQRVNALLQLKMPDLLKFEVRGPFYAHILTIVLMGDSLYVHGPAAGGSWRGGVDGDLLEVLTGLDLRGYDLRYALLGIVQPAPVDTAAGVIYPRGDRAVVPLKPLDGYARRIWVDLFRGLVVREEVGGPHARSFIRRLDDYRRVGPLLLPATVEIVQGEQGLRLEYRKYWLDRGIGRDLFRQAAQQPATRRLD